MYHVIRSTIVYASRTLAFPAAGQYEKDNKKADPHRDHICRPGTVPSTNERVQRSLSNDWSNMYVVKPTC